jgi:glucokinase
LTLVLALDVGGTKLAAGVVDETGRVRSRSRSPTPATGSAEALYEALLACAAAALRGADTAPYDLDGVGVACGGPMRWPEGAVSPLNIPAWRDFPLRRRVAAEFDGLPVLVGNDAVALAAGEHWKGTGAGRSHLLAMTVSTGIGGGLVLGGRLHHGASGNGGHVGHLVVEPDGPPCACGGRGCLEAVASGPHTVARALAEGWAPPEDAHADGRALAAAAAAGDTIAVASLTRSGQAVGRALASCANLLDLEVAAVAGGLADAGPSFWDPLRETFAIHARMAFAAACLLTPARLGADTVLLGAAAFILLGERYGWAVPPA